MKNFTLMSCAMTALLISASAQAMAVQSDTSVKSETQVQVKYLDKASPKLATGYDGSGSEVEAKANVGTYVKIGGIEGESEDRSTSQGEGSIKLGEVEVEAVEADIKVEGVEGETTKVMIQDVEGEVMEKVQIQVKELDKASPKLMLKTDTEAEVETNVEAEVADTEVKANVLVRVWTSIKSWFGFGK